MCMICIDRAKGKLTLVESFKNLFEMSESIGEEHYNEILNQLMIESANDDLDPDMLKDISDAEINNMLDFWFNDNINWKDIV